jgi:hypothetical protein
LAATPMIAESYIAAPVVNNRLADKQECCLPATRAFGRTAHAAAAKERGHPQGLRMAEKIGF